jgi:hypothetical protein
MKRHAMTVPMLVIAALTLGGCAAFNTGEAATKLSEAKITLASEKVAQTAALAEAKEKGDTKAEAKATETLATIETLEKRLADAEKVLASVASPDGSIDPAKAVGAAGALLPPPWNLAVMLGLPVVIGAVQELRRRSAVNNAVSMVNGLEAAKAVSPSLRSQLKASENVIKKEYTPGAVALVKKHKLASE